MTTASTTTPFLKGLLNLAVADEEVALIPPAQTFLSALQTSKNSLQRAAIVAQFEGNALAAEAGVAPTLLAQVIPQVNGVMQALLAKAQAEVTAAAQNLIPPATPPATPPAS
jgi:hypothetical protein